MAARRFSSICGCTRGAAAAEMALIMPLLLVILFGGLEAGTYFWTEHKVVKGVRDGARYAARLPFTTYSGCNAPTGTALDNIRNLTRTGRLSGGTAKVPGWINTDVAVTIACQPSAPNSYTSGGVYATETTGAMHVTVSTTVTYPSLFGTLGFDTTGAVVRASSNAAVMGT